MAAVVPISVDTDQNDSDQDVDALIGGVAWDIDATNGVITYSFPTAAGQLGYTLASGATFNSGFSTAQQDTAEDAMAMVESYTNIDFQEGTETDATVRWFNVDGIGTAFGYFPNTGNSGGDMAFADGQFESNLEIGTYQTTTFMHELGHALGLKHGHECACPLCADEDSAGAMPTDQDSMEYSVMTYRSYDGHDLDELPFYVNSNGSYAQTYMISDIAALQRLYGANYETNSDDTVYTFDQSTGEMFVNGIGQGAGAANVVFRSVWDGDGEDTYDLSNYTTDLYIDLQPGAYSDFDVGGNFQRAELNFGAAPDPNNPGNFIFGSEYEVYADGHLYNAYLHEGNEQSLIENAIGGSGKDEIIGNDANNTLEGKGKRDKLDGLKGNDSLSGGSGNDLLSGGAGKDSLFGGSGRDTLLGGSGDDMLNGGALDDKLNGGNGDDEFVFKVGTGSDTIVDFNNPRSRKPGRRQCGV